MKAQWKNLRDNLKRCLAKRANMSKSGAEAHTLTKCKYFDQLQFLQEKITNKETVSNLSFSNCSPSPQSSLNSPEGPICGSSVALNSPPLALNSPPLVHERARSPSPSVIPPIKRRSVGKKANKTAPIDNELINVIKDMNTATKTLVSTAEPKNDTEDNENMLFCKSLAPILDRLTKRDAAIAKMEIQKALFDIEFKE